MAKLNSSPLDAHDLDQLAAAGLWRDRLDWYEGPGQPRHITVRRIDGFWVVRNCGVYRTVDALFARQREMVEAHDLDDIESLRFGFTLRSRWPFDDHEDYFDEREAELEDMTIVALRKEAKKIGLTAAEIKGQDKDDLVDLILNN